MTSTTVETKVAPAESTEKLNGVVDTLFDLGLAWAAYGLKIATNAVEHSAKTLGITAKALDRLADELAQKTRAEDDKNTVEAAK